MKEETPVLNEQRCRNSPLGRPLLQPGGGPPAGAGRGARTQGRAPAKRWPFFFWLLPKRSCGCGCDRINY